MQSNKVFLIAGILIALLLGGVFAYWQKPEWFSTLNEGDKPGTTIDVGGGIHVPTSGEGVSVLPVENPKAQAPSLDRVIPATSPNFNPEAMAQVRAKMTDLIAQLKTDPQQLKLWLQLGVDRKEVGDYEGAKEAWEYVAAAAPSNWVAYNNLGDLYMNYLKDYPQAETNYKKVITLKPNYIDTYRSLYTLYHFLYKTNTTAAADILAQGLKANPGNADLLKLQADLKAGK